MAEEKKKDKKGMGGNSEEMEEKREKERKPTKKSGLYREVSLDDRKTIPRDENFRDGGTL